MFLRTIVLFLYPPELSVVGFVWSSPSCWSTVSNRAWRPSTNLTNTNNLQITNTDGSESFGQSFRNSTFGYALIVAKRSRGQEVIPWAIYLQRRLDLKLVWWSWRLNRVYLTFYLEVSFPHQGFCSSPESLWSVAGVALWTSYHRAQNMVRWLKEREQEWDRDSENQKQLLSIKVYSILSVFIKSSCNTFWYANDHGHQCICKWVYDIIRRLLQHALIIYYYTFPWGEQATLSC